MAMDIGRFIDDFMSATEGFRKKKSEDEEKARIQLYQNNLDVEEARNTGALARQRLMNEGNITAADITGKAHIASANANAGATEFAALQGAAGHRLTADTERYKADQGLAGAGKGLLGEKIKGSVALLNDPNTSDEDRKTIGRNLRAMLSEGQQRDAASFDSATPSSPGGNAKPGTPGPARAAVGGKSMTFDTEENPMVLAPRKKKAKTAEDYLFNR